MSDDWFHALFGFEELSYGETRRRLDVVGARLRSRVNGASYAIGELEIPTLVELRDRARLLAGGSRGRLSVSIVTGDVGAMHSEPANRNALFQVASQFNLPEMRSPGITPGAADRARHRVGRPRGQLPRPDR
jgi:hypothetical protein